MAQGVRDGLDPDVTLETALEALAFNADGLIPAIAQSATDGAVLMLAWMNRAAIEMTLAEGQVVYWSRSRQSFWRKGETSGNVQRLVELRIDCDADCLLLLVDQTGPACHTLRRSCFFTALRDGRTVRIAEPMC
ncbi:MAG: phosphoribosyl-AMP cyclohydrolase [Pseudomonadota bacterium]